jgi:RNA polymerase sigma-70 factor (ECF subfamily)
MDPIPEFDEILAGARAGEAWAFERLWRTLNPALDRYFRVAAPDAAEDLASETWLQAARDIRRFRGDEHAFRRWLFTIARHRLLDHQRKHRRDKTDPVAHDSLPESVDTADLVEERLSTAQALALIRTLPPAQAEAVTLRVVAGLPVADVARLMGKRPGTVRVLTSRGLRALADHLECVRLRDPNHEEAST